MPEVNNHLAPPPTNQPAAEIYVMPHKFYAPPPKSKTKAIVITALLLLIIASISITVVWYWQIYQKSQQAYLNSQANVTINVPQNASENLNSANQNTNLSGNNLNAGSGLITSGNANTLGNQIDGNINVPLENSNLPTLSVEPVPASLDSDHDNLTDAEEIIFKSNPKKPDTDGDGYLDGEEVLSGYSPISANKKLVDDGLIKIYSNAKHGYSLSYPSIWEPTVSEDEKTVSFTAGESEVLSLNLEENTAGLSPQDWYLKLMPQANVSQLGKISVGNFSGIKSANKLNIYLASATAVPNQPNPIFIFSESIGIKTNADYQSILLFLARNLKNP